MKKIIVNLIKSEIARLKKKSCTCYPTIIYREKNHFYFDRSFVIIEQCALVRQSWALSAFLNIFSNKKLVFAFFIKLI